MTFVLAVAVAVLVAPASAHAAQQDVNLLTDVPIRIDGANFRTEAGDSVANAGDVNGDGKLDLAVGGDDYAYVLYGPPAAADLQNLPASHGFRIEGVVRGHFFGPGSLHTGITPEGTPVAAAGDVNGDGRDDIIVGAPFDSHTADESGSAYVIYGAANQATVDVTTLTPSEGFRIDGAAEHDAAGWAVAGAGDVNGDGKDDVIVGVRVFEAPGEHSYVIYGSASSANVDLSNVGARGFKITGAGQSVANAGDVNGDGRADLAFGNCASAFVVFGSSTPANVDLAALAGKGARLDGAGCAVAAAGDVNGDGAADLVVGDPRKDNNDRNLSGSAYVVYGPLTANVDLESLPADGGFRIDGAVPGAEGDEGRYGGGANGAGYSVAGAGDVNADGKDDVAVGEPNYGSAWVVYGASSGANVDLANLPQSVGFRLDGGIVGDEAGFSVAGAGDVNADGRADVVVGTPSANNNNRAYSGSAYVFTGDRDGDLVQDASDNCVAAANAGQANTDGDALGDACDPDDDGDGLLDTTEAQIGSDPKKVDTDLDGRPDGQDACPTQKGSAQNGCPLPVSVAFAAPAGGALLSTTSPTSLVATTTGDSPVASVGFYANGRLVCTDTAAPYGCAYRPRGADVGTTQLAALATDVRGRRTVDVRQVRVPRFAPLGLTLTRKRTGQTVIGDGELRIPNLVALGRGCLGAVSLTAVVGAKSITVRGPLTSTAGHCRYHGAIALPKGAAKVSLRASFAGNSVLSPASATAANVGASRR